jgi:excisionase family DNA binding protein
MPQFFTIAETAKILHLTRATVSKKISIKEIPVTRVGSRALIPAVYFENLTITAMSSGNTPPNKSVLETSEAV